MSGENGGFRAPERRRTLFAGRHGMKLTIADEFPGKWIDRL